MKRLFTCAVVLWGLASLPVGRAAGAELVLTRPGQIVVTAVTGEVTLVAAGQPRPAKIDDRVRIDTLVKTGRKSEVVFSFSNGVVLDLASESELEVDELLQAPFAGNPKPETMKEEPSVSRSRIRLNRGEARLTAKPLKVAQGSVFAVEIPAGSVQLAEGSLLTTVRMSEAGLGVCVIELTRGRGEFQAVGAKAPAPLPVGRRLTFAIEIDRRTGAAKVGPMPEPGAPAKK